MIQLRRRNESRRVQPGKGIIVRRKKKKDDQEMKEKKQRRE